MNAWALAKRWMGESRLLLAACAIGLLAFCWVRVWIVGRLPASSFEIILEQVWDKYEKYSPVPLRQLITYHGRVALAFEEPIVVLCIAVWAIARGSDTVAGHINRGVMEMLLAQPVSRGAVYLTQSAVTVLGVALLSVCMWCGVAIGIQTTKIPEEHRPGIKVPGIGMRLEWPFGQPRIEHVPMSTKTSPRHFVYPAINLFCLGILLAGFATFLSAVDRHRWRTIGIVVSVMVVEMVLRIVSMAAEPLAWLKYLTFFTAYEPEVIVSLAVNSAADLWKIIRTDDAGRWMPGPMGYNLILFLPGCVFFALGHWWFCRRDIPAPL